MAAGDPAERRFYRAELTREERIPEYARFLDTHLLKTRVVSGEARRSAEKRHESNRERENARKAIPGAWRTLLETPDEMLRDLLAEEVERSCGTKPEPEDVASFLKEGLSTLPGTTRMAPPTPPPRPRSPSSILPVPTGRGNKKPGRIIGFILDNERLETGFGYRTLGEVIKEFDRRDPEFMVRFQIKPQLGNGGWLHEIQMTSFRIDLTLWKKNHWTWRMVGGWDTISVQRISGKK